MRFTQVKHEIEINRKQHNGSVTSWTRTANWGSGKRFHEVRFWNAEHRSWL